MTPFYVAPGNRLALAALPVVVVITGLLILHPIHLGASSNLPKIPNTGAPAAYAAGGTSTVYLSENAASSAAATVSTASLELHIANNGLTLVRGARITSLSGGSIGLLISWSGAELRWSAHTAYGTEILDNTGNKATFGSLHVGDIVTVTGQLDQGGGTPSITAQYIRDQSI